MGHQEMSNFKELFCKTITSTKSFLLLLLHFHFASLSLMFSIEMDAYRPWGRFWFLDWEFSFENPWWSLTVNSRSFIARIFFCFIIFTYMWLWFCYFKIFAYIFISLFYFSSTSIPTIQWSTRIKMWLCFE